MSYKIHMAKLKNKFLTAFEEEDFLKALLTGERLLKLLEENAAADTRDFADSSFNVGYIYMETDRPEKALTYYSAALNIYNSFDEVYTKTADILTNMAICYNMCRKTKDSLRCFGEALEVKKKLIKDTTNKSYINSVYNLGNAYLEAGDFDKAVNFHKEALSLRKSTDMDYIDNLNSLGYAYEGKKEYNLAINYLESAIELIKKTEGVKSEEYLKNIYYIAGIYEHEKNYMEAKMYYEKAVELLKHFLSEKHPYYAEAVNKLANIYVRLNNNEQALVLRTKALNIIKEIVGENHLYYASSLKNTADIYMKLKDFDKAKQLYLEAIKIKINILGMENLECINDKLSLARAFKQLGEYENACEILEEYIKNPPKNEMLYLECLMELSSVYIIKEDTKKLYEVYEEFAKLEPGLSFDDMLSELKEYELEERSSNYSELDFDELENLEGDSDYPD